MKTSEERFKCAQCGLEDEGYLIDNDDQFYVSTCCDSRLVPIIKQPKLWVNVYEVFQAYGGPEEGGWWYDCGEPVSSQECLSEDAAHELLAKIRDAIKNGDKKPEGYRMGNGPHDGCDPDGNGDDDYLIPGGQWGDGKYVACLESKPGEPFPETTPHYE